MRILHTSDWHLGRQFHGVALDEVAAGDWAGRLGRHGELRVKERWEGTDLSDGMPRYLSRPSDRLGNSDNITSATQLMMKNGRVTMNIFPGLAPVTADATKSSDPRAGSSAPTPG